MNFEENGSIVMVEYAEITDIGALTELRLRYLQEDNGDLSEEDIKKIRKDLPVYFERNLNQNIFCYLIREKEEVAACAFLLVVEKPLSPAFITGKTGTVMNVYTKPEYRHKGYAKRIMQKILYDAVEKELSVVELKSTDSGYQLYKSVGFKDDTSKYHFMKWCKPVD